ncbi:MAG: hypothetical protein HC853_14145 [Anaerolineae bacterium]|nr:hypothetical protein [Anaerolineae bacterium]
MACKHSRPRRSCSNRSRAPQFWLAQFVGLVKDDWLDDLRANGLQIVAYMPNNAYVVWGDGAALDRLDARVTQFQTNQTQSRRAANAVVQWAGAYQPSYRLDPSLQLSATNGSAELVDVTVQVYETPNTATTLANLTAQAAQVFVQADAVPGQIPFARISLRAPANRLAAFASRPDVFNVEPYVRPTFEGRAPGADCGGQCHVGLGQACSQRRKLFGLVAKPGRADEYGCVSHPGHCGRWH